MLRNEARRRTLVHLVCASALAAIGTFAAPGIAAPPGVPTAAHEHARVREVIAHDLPPIDGRRLRVTVLEVRYGPGESSPPRSHPCAVVGYVLAGALRTQVDDQPAVVVRAGEAFFEAPGAAHRVSANASATEEARFLATFTCDAADPASAELSAPLPDVEH